MNSKKCFILEVTLLTFLIGLNTTLWGQEPNDPNDKIKVLQEKIKQLESVVRHTENEKASVVRKLDEQIKENERLKNLCSQIGIDTSPQKNEKPSKAEDPNMIKVGLEQLYQLFTVKSRSLTNLQKDVWQKELLKNYGGKYVQWTGRITSISNFIKDKKDAESHCQMQFIYQNFNSGFMADVRVEFPETMKQRLLSLNKGSLITYQGKLPDNYEHMKSLEHGNLTLTDGRIISVKP